MKFTKIIFVFLAVFVCQPLQCESNADVKLLVLLGDASGTRIEFFTQDELVGQRIGRGVGSVFGLIGMGIGASTSSSERDTKNRKYSEQLKELIDSSKDRKRTILQDGLNKVFNRWHDVFEITVLTHEESTAYLNESKRIDRDAIAKDGYNYFVVLKEALLYQTPEYDPGEVVPDFHFAIDLYNVKRHTPLALKEFRTRFNNLRELKELLDTPDAFLEDYARSADKLCRHLYGQLDEKKRLHAISASYGKGELFPLIDEVKKQNADRFSYRFNTPDAWKARKSGDGYVYELHPEKHRNIIGITTTIEIEGLTQFYDSADDGFLEYYFRDLLDQDWTIDRNADFKLPGLTGDWNRATVVSPAAGKIFFAYRKEDQHFLLTHSVKILADNTDLFLSYYEKDIAEYLKSSSLIVKDH